MKKIVYNTLIFFLLLITTPAKSDLTRGLENYLAILKGDKVIQDLNSEEILEVSAIFNRLKSRQDLSKNKPEYQIELNHNDMLFVINGEKYRAESYCFGWNVGDYVIFVNGNEYGACTKATLLNTSQNELCDVICEKNQK